VSIEEINERLERVERTLDLLVRLHKAEIETLRDSLEQLAAALENDERVARR